MESALVLVPFLALLLGIIDFGISLFVRSTIQSAVATGVRSAVTYHTESGQCMDNSIRLATQASAMGFLGNSTTPNPSITVNYYSPSDLTNALSGPANQPGNIVEVTAVYQWSWLNNLSGKLTAAHSNTPLNVVAYSSDRLGNLPPGQTAPCR